MGIKFYKYQGAGNDFIIFDNRDKRLSTEMEEWIELICDRRFGIGADGVIYFQFHPQADFEMIYFNADGKRGSMCGNGARCIVKFAKEELGEIGLKTKFIAFDGLHEAEILEEDLIRVSMADVNSIGMADEDYVLNTGSPHYVRMVERLDEVNVTAEGAAIRQAEPFSEDGINVNFFEVDNEQVFMRTYERGVEDETLSCGSGTVAVAISYALKNNLPEGKHVVPITALGGNLSVQFIRGANNSFTDIWLMGPTERVFEGFISM